LNFLDRVLKNAQISDFMKILPVGAELFPYGWNDGLTDTTKLIVAFQNYVNPPASEFNV
jgi:hypothetical protein